MKKIFYLFSIAFLMLQSCSSENGDNLVDDNILLMRKWYDNSYQCSNGNRDYYEFSSPNIFKHYVTPSSMDCNYILPEYGTWTRNGSTILLKYDHSLSIWDATLTIEQLTANTFSFVAEGSLEGYFVLTSN